MNLFVGEIYMYALLYFPQKSEDNTYVLSQCRDIVQWTIDCTYTVVCKYRFVSIYIISHFVYFSHSWIMHLVEDK